MKIICVGYLHGSGGAERQIIMLANAMADLGHDVTLAVMAEYNKKYDISKQVRVEDLTYIEKDKGNKPLHRFEGLKKLYSQIKPDLSVHFWLQSAYLSAFMTKKITGKVIYAERGDPGDSEYDGLLGLVRKVAFYRIDGFVFQSEGARNYFGQSVREKSIVIHNSVCVPEDKFVAPCAKREKKIISVGRLHPQKNQKLLIHSFANIASVFPEYTLEIYGDGELRDELQKLIDELGLSERAFLKGTTKNVLDYVYTASLFVLSSDYEGMPNALMEAMAIGVPSISTDCRPGGARTIIDDGVNGWVVPRKNVDLLAHKIKFVLSNEDFAEKVGSEALKIRFSHSSKEIFDKWEQYIDLITSK